MPTVFITGASRGIGLAFARQYAADGWGVIASCRDPDTAENLIKLAQSYPSVQLEALDVGEEGSIDELSTTLKDVPIDVLINNAGITAQGRGLIGWDDSTGDYTGTLDHTAWRRVININTVGPIMVTLALLPNIKFGEQRKVIMISSRCGSADMSLFPEYISYNTSKAALNIGMRNMAKLLEPQGIAFASIHPGSVATDMGGQSAPLEPEESVTSMRKIIEGLDVGQSGRFWDYSGSFWPW
ncbi:MAG: SDR family oxidoreductase [Alphaproteobacteria bacterium]|nr:SDR family oxidoreductase [Alphaproteobacteria bacterium]